MDDVTSSRLADAAVAPQPRSRLRVVPVLLTLIAVAVAGVAGWAAWDAYMAAPWTRDGTVRAYVVTIASEVAGRIVALPVPEDQLVAKGALLIGIDPTDYRIAEANAQASVAQAQVDLRNKQDEAARRERLSALSTSVEERQTYVAAAQAANATLQQSLASLGQARVNLARTQIRSPVNGYVTNLTTQVGDYAGAGERIISLVDADSYWVDGYFEETQLGAIHVGDRARIKLMGYRAPLLGRVAGISRGIEVANAQSDPAGLATVNPVFTWIRLAQRIPVRIALDPVPAGVTLVVGMTATVQIEEQSGNGPAVLAAPAR